MRPWTHPERRRALRMRTSEHLPVREIAERLGRSRRAVEHVLQANNVRRPAHQPWTSDELQRLAELRAQGVSLANISREIGRSLDGVKQQLRKPRDLAFFGPEPKPEHSSP